MKFSYAREGLQLKGVPSWRSPNNDSVQLLVSPEESIKLMDFLKSIHSKPTVNFCFHCGSKLPHIAAHPEYCTTCHNGKKNSNSIDALKAAIKNELDRADDGLPKKALRNLRMILECDSWAV
jgi:hypothetical protein